MQVGSQHACNTLAPVVFVNVMLLRLLYFSRPPAEQFDSCRRRSFKPRFILNREPLRRDSPIVIKTVKWIGITVLTYSVGALLIGGRERLRVCSEPLQSLDCISCCLGHNVRPELG